MNNPSLHISNVWATDEEEEAPKEEAKEEEKEEPKEKPKEEPKEKEKEEEKDEEKVEESYLYFEISIVCLDNPTLESGPSGR